jgi:hypothetical protein
VSYRHSLIKKLGSRTPQDLQRAARTRRRGCPWTALTSAEAHVLPEHRSLGDSGANGHPATLLLLPWVLGVLVVDDLRRAEGPDAAGVLSRGGPSGLLLLLGLVVQLDHAQLLLETVVVKARRIPPRSRRRRRRAPHLGPSLPPAAVTRDRVTTGIFLLTLNITSRCSASTSPTRFLNQDQRSKKGAA